MGARKGRPTATDAWKIKKSILDLLPEGEPIQSSLLKQKAEGNGFSSKTLFKYLKNFEELDIVERYIDDEEGAPKVMYKKRLLKKYYPLLQHMEGRQFTVEQNELFLRLYFNYLMTFNNITSIIYNACQWETLSKAQSFVNLHIDIGVKPLLLDALKANFENRKMVVGSKPNQTPVIAYVSDQFYGLAEKAAKKWLTSFCPSWGKKYIGKLPNAELVGILINHHREEAIKMICNI